MVWNSSETDLLVFMEKLANHNYNPKFTMHVRSIPFLDVIIFKQGDGTLGTSLYRKPTTGNTILHASSAHPQPLIRSILYSQYLGIRRNWSNEDDFLKESKSLRARLLERGYTKTTLKKAYNKACLKNRHELLFGTKVNKQEDTVRIVTTYSNTCCYYIFK